MIQVSSITPLPLMPITPFDSLPILVIMRGNVSIRAKNWPFWLLPMLPNMD